MHIRPWLVGLSVPLAVFILGAMVPGSSDNAFGVFTLSSLQSYLIAIVAWALIGRGLHAIYHSRFRGVFWILVIILALMFLRGAYVGAQPEGQNRGLHLIAL